MPEKWPSVTHILKSHGFFSEFAMQDRAAATRGSLVHASSHIVAKREDIDPLWLDRHKELDGYLAGYRKWFAQSGVGALLWAETEIQDQCERFIGHPDQIFESASIVAEAELIDIKTGAIPAWAGLQLAGYEKLVRTIFPKRRFRRFVLNLPGDGSYKIVPFNDPRDLDNWVILCRAYWVKAKYLGETANG